MTYFTDVSTKGPVLSRQLPRVIGIVESPDKRTLIGTASERGRTDDGLAVWFLKVRGVEVPGHFVVVDGAFVQVEPAQV
jgi:hypothetical protein